MNARADLQSVLARFLPAYARGHRLDSRRRQVLSHLEQCRTPALGGFALHCEHCDDVRVHYHACRDRHCPKCQRRATQRWSARQRAALFNVPYFHLVFTLPHALNGWVALHDAELYHALFSAAWTTLNTFGHDPRRGLGGQLGMTAVLHTWGENLSRHVHLHGLVPGGALQDSGAWKAARASYLFPVKALSRHFRGTMVRTLREAAEAGKLDRVTRPGEVETMLRELMASEWVVYAKPCLSHEASVVEYLARYTHRIAISDERIVAIDEDTVRFTWRDSSDNRTRKVMSLAGEEFIRRYLQHVLPKGLMRIRHYGLLANRCRRQASAQIDIALSSEVPTTPPATDVPAQPFTGMPCAACGRGWMVIVGELPRGRDPGSGRPHAMTPV